MNTIMSLINLQSNTLTNQEAIKALEDAANRIRSMMILYDKLFCTSSFEDLSIREYISPLIDEIISIFPNRKSVAIEKHIDDIILKAKILFPLGIIINELLTNAMKHAFTGRERGMILVSFKIADKKAVATVIDNGIGVPEYIDFENTEHFGLNLINIMAKQIHGKIRIERQNGTAFILEFEI
jgi:two-component sensor histidine kinase